MANTENWSNAIRSVNALGNEAATAIDSLKVSETSREQQRKTIEQLQEEKRRLENDLAAEVKSNGTWETNNREQFNKIRRAAALEFADNRPPLSWDDLANRIQIMRSARCAGTTGTNQHTCYVDPELATLREKAADAIAETNRIREAATKMDRERFESIAIAAGFYDERTRPRNWEELADGIRTMRAKPFEPPPVVNTTITVNGFEGPNAEQLKAALDDYVDAATRALIPDTSCRSAAAEIRGQKNERSRAVRMLREFARNLERGVGTNEKEFTRNVKAAALYRAADAIEGTE